MAVGALTLVLHSHLPYVLHHGRFPHGSEWLCEAVAECYLPLLGGIRRLVRRGLLPRWTLEFSPVLCEQLAQPAFRVLFQQYCRDKMAAARDDELHFLRYGYGEQWVRLARFWQSWYAARLEEFLEEYRGEILGAFARLQELGVLELAGSAATHAYLPLLPSEQAVAFQLRVGVETYRRHFRRAPDSFWLPECGYYPAGDRTAVPLYGEMAARMRGVEEWLARLGVGGFVVEQQLLERAQVWTDAEALSPTVRLLQPQWCVSSPDAGYGCTVLARYQLLAARIWDARTGYPGDGDYLDFHKRHYTSWLRYWRVTDNRLDMQYKLLYVPEWAEGKARQHAEHFAELVVTTLAQVRHSTALFPVACLPFDTELFGHWWFEGPMFLEHLVERLTEAQQVELWTFRECRQRVGPAARVRLPAGSWGKDAGHEPWGNPQVWWMWHAVAQAERQLNELLRRFPAPRRTPVHDRLFCQALRELLLMQASDWSFLVVTGSARDYAEQRFTFHAQDFQRLLQLLEQLDERGELRPDGEAFLQALEQRDALFPELRLHWWEEPL